MDEEIEVRCSVCDAPTNVDKMWYEIPREKPPTIKCDSCSDGPIGFEFEIMPFEYLPPWIRWAYAEYCNKEEGYQMFNTVDEVDGDPDFWSWYGAVLSDGGWIVDEDFSMVMDSIILQSELDEKEKGK